MFRMVFVGCSLIVLATLGHAQQTKSHEKDDQANLKRDEALRHEAPRTIRGLCLPPELIALPPHVLDIVHLSQHGPNDISELLAVALVTRLENAIGQLAAGERLAAAFKDIQQSFA